MEKTMVITTQRTAKKYKGAILIAWGMLLAGGVAIAAGAPAGAALCVLSVPTWIGAKVLAWWNHA